jgi:hypothetical protein
VSLDLESLRKKVAAHATEQANAKVQVLALEPLAGGACQENFRVDLAIDHQGKKRMVLRSDAKASLAAASTASRIHQHLKQTLSNRLAVANPRFDLSPDIEAAS